MIDLNATQAAIRAGYSPETANEQSSRLLVNVSICARIDITIAERSRRTGVNQDRVILEHAKLAFVNAADVIDIDEAIVKEGARPEDTVAIQSVKVKKSSGANGETIERKIKIADKVKALELLGRHLGMFNDKMNVSVGFSVGSSEKLDDILSQIGGGALKSNFPLSQKYIDFINTVENVDADFL